MVANYRCVLKCLFVPMFIDLMDRGLSLQPVNILSIYLSFESVCEGLLALFETFEGLFEVWS